MTPPPMTTTEAWEGRVASGMVCSCGVRAGCPGEPTVRPRLVLPRDHRQGSGGTSRGVARLRRAGGWYAENVSRIPAARYPLRGGDRGGSLDRTRHRQGGSSESGCWPTSASSDCAWACTVGELAVGGQRRRGFQDPPGAVGRRSRFAHSVDCATSQGDEESSANRGSASATHGRHVPSDRRRPRAKPSQPCATPDRQIPADRRALTDEKK